MVDLYWPSSKSAIILRSRSCMKGNRAQVHRSEEDRTDKNLLSPSGFASTLVPIQSRNDLRNTVEREREREKRKQDIIGECTKAAGAERRGRVVVVHPPSLSLNSTYGLTFTLVKEEIVYRQIKLSAITTYIHIYIQSQHTYKYIYIYLQPIREFVFLYCMAVSLTG
jgi:hypothetical protein